MISEPLPALCFKEPKEVNLEKKVHAFDDISLIEIMDDRKLNWVLSFLSDQYLYERNAILEESDYFAKRGLVIKRVKDYFTKDKSGKIVRYLEKYYIDNEYVDWIFNDLAASIFVYEILKRDRSIHIKDANDLKLNLENLLNLDGLRIVNRVIEHVPYSESENFVRLPGQTMLEHSLEYFARSSIKEDKVDAILRLKRLYDENYKAVKKLLLENKFDATNKEKVNWAYAYMRDRALDFYKYQNSIDNKIKLKHPNYLVEFITYNDIEDENFTQQYDVIVANLCLINFYLHHKGEVLNDNEQKLVIVRYDLAFKTPDYLSKFIEGMYSSWRKRVHDNKSKPDNTVKLTKTNFKLLEEYAKSVNLTVDKAINHIITSTNLSLLSPPVEKVKKPAYRKKVMEPVTLSTFEVREGHSG